MEETTNNQEYDLNIQGTLMESDPSTIAPTPTITDEEKEHFFKALLSDTPYTEEVELFDGQMTISLRSMTVKENADVVKQISNDREADVASNDDAYFVTISAYRLAISLQVVNGTPFSEITSDTFKPAENDKFTTYVKARAETIKNWPTFKLAAFLDAFGAFERKVVKLTNSVQTKNFWKASA
jgi:hypothetical protein